ncbi:MAG: D-alanyl-D-alanine carboxypeptidase [Oscillospiraceae bacterium]|nr:D-alanyl-D-alanine carboxypeptidase [Oscillospiraceae bacterium]
MKTFIYILLISVSAASFNAPAYTNESVNAYVLIEAETGEILLSHNENEQFPITSLAKIMTLLIIAEELAAGNISFADSVPAPPEVMGLKAPVIWLDPGEVFPLGELVKAVVMSSANDAVLALAVYAGSSAQEFTNRMNARAAELGMANTFFADPGGFNEDTVSTARDIAIMTAALFNDGLHEILDKGSFFTTRLSEVRKGTERESQLVNTNRMAQWYDGILGGKAGHSRFAGLCIANCAERGSMRLVAVVLGSAGEDERDALCEQLLDSGFADFEYFEPEIDASGFSPLTVTRGVEKAVEVVPSLPVRFISHRDEAGEAVFEAALPENIEAPIEEGQVVGTFTVRLGDKIVFECDLTAVCGVEELTFIKSAEFMTERFFGC